MISEVSRNLRININGNVSRKYILFFSVAGPVIFPQPDLD